MIAQTSIKLSKFSDCAVRMCFISLVIQIPIEISSARNEFGQVVFGLGEILHEHSPQSVDVVERLNRLQRTNALLPGQLEKFDCPFHCETLAAAGVLQPVFHDLAIGKLIHCCFRLHDIKVALTDTSRD